MTEDNIVEFTGEWQGDDLPELLDEEYEQAMEDINVARISDMIGRVLELLTLYAIENGPFYITSDDERAVTIIAVEDDTKAVLDILPDNFKSWESILASQDYVANRDLGDEQSEPTT